MDDKKIEDGSLNRFCALQARLFHDRLTRSSDEVLRTHPEANDPTETNKLGEQALKCLEIVIQLAGNKKEASIVDNLLESNREKLVSRFLKILFVELIRVASKALNTISSEELQLATAQPEDGNFQGECFRPTIIKILHKLNSYHTGSDEPFDGVSVFNAELDEDTVMIVGNLSNELRRLLYMSLVQYS